MSATMKDEMQPAIYRFKFGNFEITNILDGKVIRRGLHPSFGPERGAGEARDLCLANNIDSDRYEHPFIPTLINTGKQMLSFDTGNGALRREYEQLRNRLSDGQLVSRLAEAGYQPADIDIVVITHGHPDHIGGLMKGGQPIFPKARYVFGAAEFDFWKRGENVREARKFNRELFVNIVAACRLLSFRHAWRGNRSENPCNRRCGTFSGHAGLSRRKRRQTPFDLGR